MFFEHGVEISGLARRILALIAHVEAQPQRVEQREHEPELCGRLAVLELADPLARDARTGGQLCLGETCAQPLTAHDGCKARWDPRLIRGSETHSGPKP
jgi:hypothetical protein